jgi:hypothetical protein
MGREKEGTQLHVLFPLPHFHSDKSFFHLWEEMSEGAKRRWCFWNWEKEACYLNCPALNSACNLESPKVDPKRP